MGFTDERVTLHGKLSTEYSVNGKGHRKCHVETFQGRKKAFWVSVKSDMKWAAVQDLMQEEVTITCSVNEFELSSGEDKGKLVKQLWIDDISRYNPDWDDGEQATAPAPPDNALTRKTAAIAEREASKGHQTGLALFDSVAARERLFTACLIQTCEAGIAEPAQAAVALYRDALKALATPEEGPRQAEVPPVQHDAGPPEDEIAAREEQAKQHAAQQAADDFDDYIPF